MKERFKRLAYIAEKHKDFLMKRGKLIEKVLNEYRNNISATNAEKKELMDYIILGVKTGLLPSEMVHVDKVEHDLLALTSDLPDDVYDISSYINIPMLEQALIDTANEVRLVEEDIIVLKSRTA